jgi:hypothetical protein
MFGYGSESSTNVVLLDRTLRCVMSAAVRGDHVFEIDSIIEAATAMQAWNPEVASGAPVLVLDRILEPELCNALIDYYVRTGGTDSGFMKEINGSIVVRKDPRIKRSLDCTIKDGSLLELLTSRLQKRLRPMILKAFQCNATRVEHHVVARYDAADGGFFRRHRSNTSKATGHFRFVIAINLNAENYEGGDLWFPEFGDQTYRASTGGAVVFSCSLLHEELPVDRGVRYAYLPFLSDGVHGRMHSNIKQTPMGMLLLADPNGSYGRT